MRSPTVKLPVENLLHCLLGLSEIHRQKSTQTIVPHGHTIERICCVHSDTIVGDEYELRLSCKILKDICEAKCICFIECSLYLVEEDEW